MALGSDVESGFGSDAPITIGIASINTRRATEVAIRSIARTTGGNVSIWVGDCGSTDGSVAMLERACRRGLISRLDIRPGSSHGAWIDFWKREATTRWLLAADSDVEPLRRGWLDAMVETAARRQVGAVAAGLQEQGSYTQPNGFTVRTLRRPTIYVFLVDLVATEKVDVSFQFHLEQAGDGEWDAWDTGARFARALEDAGIGWTPMPASFADDVRHIGKLSWMKRERHLPKDAGERRRLLWGRRKTELFLAWRLWRYRLRLL
jgi:hypothetical protein